MIKFLSHCFDAHDPNSYRRQKIGLTLRFLSECHLMYTDRLFLF